MVNVEPSRITLPLPSSIPASSSVRSSGLASDWCSFHMSPLSLLKTISSRSFPRMEPKWGISTITGLKQKIQLNNQPRRSFDDSWLISCTGNSISDWCYFLGDIIKYALSSIPCSTENCNSWTQKVPSILLPEELSPSWSDLHQPADQSLSLYHGWGVGQFVSFGQATGDACGCRALPGRDNDAHAIVAAASHRTTAGIHHEADQEPTRRSRVALGEEKKKEQNDKQKQYHGHKWGGRFPCCDHRTSKQSKEKRQNNRNREIAIDRMIKRRQKDALSSESWQLSPSPGSMKNIRHCLKLNWELLKLQKV